VAAPVAEAVPPVHLAPIEAEPVVPVEVQQPASIQPASGLGGTASPVEPDPPPADAVPFDRPTTQTRPVGGIRLGLWALWRAVARFFRRLSGGRRP
jgi:hypothetical protein